MHPAFSVIFLTTLIGVGQGLFLALVTGESYAAVNLLPQQSSREFYAVGALLAMLFLIGGLIASIFHLGHPERGWRAATRWRTSWLSREVIVLPLMMGLVFLYGVVHFFDWHPDLFGVGTRNQLTLVIGAIGTVVAFALFVSTGMVYASIKFLQEWASPLTVVNYILLGGASGFTFATAFVAYNAPDLVTFYGTWAIIITFAALVGRVGSLFRNARIKRHSNIQSAIGVRHPRIQQKAMGFMGGSYNTREYHHGKGISALKSVRWTFLILTFVVPLLLLWIGIAGNGTILLAAFGVQYVGLLFERWFFLAQANHPQNLYYQTI